MFIFSLTLSCEIVISYVLQKDDKIICVPFQNSIDQAVIDLIVTMNEDVPRTGHGDRKREVLRIEDTCLRKNSK